MKLRKTLIENPDFIFKNNIFYQRDIQAGGDFEKLYISLRKKEDRLYSDETVRMLPQVRPDHPLWKEWKSRKFTLNRLLGYLRNQSQNRQPAILELGCGNGWLCDHLAGLDRSEVLGVDVNEKELLQATRVFGQRENLAFALADIFTVILPCRYFDYIILSASIQYFPHPKILIEKLFELLSDAGQIHILDSPFYNKAEQLSARKRSANYFNECGVGAMDRYYHHHAFETIAQFHPQVLYDPRSIANRIKRRFVAGSPFYWMMLSNKGAAAS